MRFSKGTLHSIEKSGKDNKPFILNANIREKFEVW